MDKLSVAIIARNEANVIGRLLKSLEGIDDVVVVDTGSTDKTVEIAKAAGCRVFEEGERFKIEATDADVKKYEELFGITPNFKAGGKYFHFANARNYAMGLCENDWVLNMDADEVMTWDLPKVLETIQDEDQLDYRFCFTHKPDGSPGLEFSHCKAWRKSKIQWVGFIHEIHAPIKGQHPKPPKYCEFIYNHHYQEPKAERGNYMPGLELSLLENPKNDRNLYYTAREYFYLGQYETAVRMFDNALSVMWWKPERGQAYIFKSQCHERLHEIETNKMREVVDEKIARNDPTAYLNAWPYKNDEKAKECLYLSLSECDTRREPFNALGDFHMARKQNDQAVCYFRAALGVPFKAHGYLNHMELYGWSIHDKLSQLYARMNAKQLAKEEWLKAIKYDDCPKSILSNVAWFYDCPLISIIVPTVRPEGFARLEKSIKENTIYPKWEIIKMDGEGTAVEKFNKGVQQANGQIVVFMADDTEATQGWLTKAFVALHERLNGRGAVAFNDGYWNESNNMMGHFMCSKDMADELGGTIWDGNFFHCGVDPLMHARLKAKKLTAFAPEAKIIHHHHHCTTKGAAKDKMDKWSQKVINWMDHDTRLLPRKLMWLGLTEDAIKWTKTYMAGGQVNGNYDLVRKLAEMGLTPEGLHALNLGIGDGKSGLASQLKFMRFDILDHVEIHKPYIDAAEKEKYAAIETDFIKMDISDIQDFSKYDVVFAFDILEHLKKEEAIKVIERVKSSGAKLLAFFPIEDEIRPNSTDVPEQEHLSTWTEDELKGLGFRTTLLPKFHKTFDACWAIL